MLKVFRDFDLGRTPSDQGRAVSQCRPLCAHQCAQEVDSVRCECVAKSKNMAVLFQAVFVLIGMFYRGSVFHRLHFFYYFFSRHSVFNPEGGPFFSSSLHVFSVGLCRFEIPALILYYRRGAQRGASAPRLWRAKLTQKCALFGCRRAVGEYPLYNWIDTFGD